MPELNPRLARLSDEQILEIFRNYTAAPGFERSVFLQLFAEALAAAPRRDFLLLRPFSLILIGKYNLGEYLAPGNGEAQRIADDFGVPVHFDEDERRRA